jgi:hypothetical protein
MDNEWLLENTPTTQLVVGDKLIQSKQETYTVEGYKPD